MSLPDVQRPRLSPPARALARALAHAAAKATWRTLHPASREHYLEASRPAPLPRVTYNAPDGWRAPLYVLPRSPGGAGEPVLLAHSLALHPDAYRYGKGPTLAGTLVDAGYQVYLFTHRGDRDAQAPRFPGEVDFDAILERDVPAALAAAVAHSGYAGVHWVGHGLGGQLGLAAAARGERRVLSVAALAAPVRFTGQSEAMRAARVASLLPGHWQLPSRALARLACPLVGEGGDLGAQRVPGASPAARVRGAMHHASDDVAAGLAAQAADWVRTGAWSSRGGAVDYAETLCEALAPLLVMCGDAEGPTAQADALAAGAAWGGLDVELRAIAGHGALDLVLGEDAEDAVFLELIYWLETRRKLAWPTGGALEDAHEIGRARA